MRMSGHCLGKAGIPTSSACLRPSLHHSSVRVPFTFGRADSGTSRMACITKEAW